MRHKLQEFLDLQQGTDSVYEYMKRFNYLTQYDTHPVNTDVNKAEPFRKGLSLPFRIACFGFVTCRSMLL
jgi:hypothetical protein